MTYFKLSVARLFITHSAIWRPDMVAVYILSAQHPFTKTKPNEEPTYTTGIRTHHIRCLSTAMIRVPWTSTVTGTKDLAYTSWECRYDLFRAINGDLLTCANTRNCWRSISTEALSTRLTALEGAWAGALAGEGRAAAVAAPAAVIGCGAAGRFGTAFYICWVLGTSSIASNTTRARAGSGRDTNTYASVRKTETDMTL